MSDADLVWLCVRRCLPACSEAQLREVYALSAVQSQRSCSALCRYFDHWVEDAHLYIQLEWCARGSLSAHIERAQSAALQALKALIPPPPPTPTLTSAAANGLMSPSTSASASACASSAAVFTFAAVSTSAAASADASTHSVPLPPPLSLFSPTSHSTASASAAMSAVSTPTATTPAGQHTSAAAADSAWSGAGLGGGVNGGGDATASASSTVFDERAVLTVALHMAQALEALHACGIAHLDVKPDNILMTADGQYKLCGMYGRPALSIPLPLPLPPSLFACSTCEVL